MCEANNLQTLVLSGLTSSSKCSIGMFYNHNIRFNYHTITGDLPSCLFNMPNLISFYADGNGIKSLLPTINSSQLVNVSLSYNQLKGSIPESWLHHSFQLLDLSQNKISGTLNGIVRESAYVNISTNFTTYYNNFSRSSLILDVNRLSGDIPENISNNHFSNLNILNGNIFSCDNIPLEDSDVKQYSCGSEELNYSFYFWTSLVGLLFILSIYYLLNVYLHSKDSNNLSGGNKLFCQIIQLLLWKSDNSSSSLVVHMIHRELSKYRYLALIISFILLTINLPIYCLLKNWYATHTYEYGWYPSLAYMEGTTPIVFTVLCFMLIWIILLYNCYRYFHEDKLDNPLFRDYSVIYSINETSTFSWSAMILLFCNFIIVSVMNGLYVFVLLNYPLDIQNLVYVILVLFKLIWNHITLMSKYSAIWKLVIIICNNMVIPILATMAVDSSCFYHLFQSPESVTSVYIVKNCYLIRFSNITENISCKEPIPQESSYIPSFTYSYQCGSAILTNYIPVYVGMYSISGILIPMIQYLIMLYYENSDSKELDKNKWIPYFLSKLFVPLDVILPLDTQNDIPKILYDFENCFLNLSLSLLVLVIFGFGYPLLSIVVLLSIIMTSIQTQIFIERHWEVIQNSSEEKKTKWESNLMNECTNMHAILYAYPSIFMLLGGLLLFILLIDEENGIISGLVMLSLLIVVQIILIKLLIRRNALDRNKKFSKDETELTTVVNNLNENLI
jgi:hypothetical protein